MISANKNILRTDFEGKKIVARKYMAKNLSWPIMLKNNSYTVVFQEKN